MNTPFLVVRNMPSLVCVWLRTGKSHLPLTCVWVSAETTELASISAASLSDEQGGLRLCV